jgi:hypothetical protein
MAASIGLLRFAGVHLNPLLVSPGASNGSRGFGVARSAVLIPHLEDAWRQGGPRVRSKGCECPFGVLTAAIEHLTRPYLRAFSSGRTLRVLTLLALVVPVPVCAAVGLSLPLPLSVERIASGLVPFASPASLDGQEAQLLGARGSIVLASGEQAGQPVRAIDASGSLAAHGPASAAGVSNGKGGVPTGKGDGSTTARPSGPSGALTPTLGSPPPAQNPRSGPSSPSGSPSTPNTGATSTQGPSEPPPQSGTPPSVVGTATSAPATALAAASHSATTATTTVAQTASGAAAATTGAVGPVFPSKP